MRHRKNVVREARGEGARAPAPAVPRVQALAHYGSDRAYGRHGVYGDFDDLGVLYFYGAWERLNRVPVVYLARKELHGR